MRFVLGTLPLWLGSVWYQQNATGTSNVPVSLGWHAILRGFMSDFQSAVKLLLLDFDGLQKHSSPFASHSSQQLLWLSC